jgi:hypothetical protein
VDGDSDSNGGDELIMIKVMTVVTMGVTMRAEVMMTMVMMMVI